MTKKEAECDFYSLDAMYVSPGSAHEAKRKECEKKYYGYTNAVKERVFNLGGIDFKIDGDFGFVLHSEHALPDPKSFRGAADIFIYKQFNGMDGVNDVSDMGNGVGGNGILVKVSYIDWDMDEVNMPSLLKKYPSFSGGCINRLKRTGFGEYIEWSDTCWGG